MAVSRKNKAKAANLLAMAASAEGKPSASTTIELVDWITRQLDSNQKKYSIQWNGMDDGDAKITVKTGKNTVEWTRDAMGLDVTWLNGEVVMPLVSGEGRWKVLCAMGFVSIALSLK